MRSHEMDEVPSSTWNNVHARLRASYQLQEVPRSHFLLSSGTMAIVAGWYGVTSAHKLSTFNQFGWWKINNAAAPWPKQKQHKKIKITRLVEPKNTTTNKAIFSHQVYLMFEGFVRVLFLLQKYWHPSYRWLTHSTSDTYLGVKKYWHPYTPINVS